MRSLWIAGMLVLAACSGNGGGGLAMAGYSCDTAPPARWSASVDPGKPVRQETMSAAGLQREMIRYGGRQAAAAGHTQLGQSASRTRLDLTLAIETQALPAGGVCAVPRRVDARLSYAERELRIAREFAADPCLRREIEAHERRHIELDDEIIAAFEPELRRRVAELAARLGPVYAAKPEQARALVERSTREWRREIAEDLDATRRRRHRAEIDTPEEYARVKTMCRGRAGEIVAAQRAQATEGSGGSAPGQ